MEDELLTDELIKKKEDVHHSKKKRNTRFKSV